MAIGGREQERRQERALDRTAVENKGSGANSVPNERNPLEQDLKLFEQLAQRSPDPYVRRDFAMLVRDIKYIESQKPLLSEAAEQLGIQKICEKLSSEEIAYYIALPREGRETRVHKILRENLVDDISRLEDLKGWDREEFLTFFSMVVNQALSREYSLRRQKNENRHGSAVRQLLVEEKSRDDLIRKLGKDVTWGLFFPREIRGKSEEAPAEAISKIWERVSEFAKVTPVAANPKALQAFMEGSLNSTPQQARDHARTLIETEIRQSHVVISAQGRNEDGKNGDSGSSSRQQTGGMQVLVEIKGSRPADQENKLLVEQLLSLPGLTSADKKIARLCLYEGRTEKETKTALGMSQGQVSKRLTVIRGLMKAALSSTQSER
jgi:hypothetical protein